MLQSSGNFNVSRQIAAHVPRTLYFPILQEFLGSINQTPCAVTQSCRGETTALSASLTVRAEAACQRPVRSRFHLAIAAAIIHHQPIPSSYSNRLAQSSQRRVINCKVFISLFLSPLCNPHMAPTGDLPNSHIPSPNPGSHTSQKTPEKRARPI